MLLISTWTTHDMSISLEKISGTILGLGVFFAVVRQAYRPLNWFLGYILFLGAGVMVAVAGLFGIQWPPAERFSFLSPLINRIPRLLRGLPGAEAGLQHNAVGGTLLWVLPSLLSLSVLLLINPRHVIHSSSFFFSTDCNLLQNPFRIRVGKLVVWFSALFVSLVFILTQSRSSYLAMGFTCIALLFLVLPARWRWALFISLLGFVIVLVLALYQIGGWNSLVDFLEISDHSGLSTRTLKIRREIWAHAIYLIQDFPIFGIGMNTFREKVREIYTLSLSPPNVDIAHAHNEYLQVAIDLGIPGLIAFLSIHIIAFWMLVDIWKASSDSLLEFPQSQPPTHNLQIAIVFGLGGGLAAHMIFGLTDAITLGAKPGVLWWMLLGLITGLHVQTAPGQVDKHRLNP
jgi:putative inorganic carbon (HCO3(-)) transporter